MPHNLFLFLSNKICQNPDKGNFILFFYYWAILTFPNSWFLHKCHCSHRKRQVFRGSVWYSFCWLIIVQWVLSLYLLKYFSILILCWCLSYLTLIHLISSWVLCCSWPELGVSDYWDTSNVQRWRKQNWETLNGWYNVKYSLTNLFVSLIYECCFKKKTEKVLLIFCQDIIC